ncbi:MAG: hypothetical protein M3P18_06945 [Actinomycetota bacterium]|nr:hypothetical protein [Actinomycetota bacterium]
MKPDADFALEHRYEVLAAQMATNRVDLARAWRKAAILRPAKRAAARLEIEVTMRELILLEADIARERDRELEER